MAENNTEQFPIVPVSHQDPNLDAILDHDIEALRADLATSGTARVARVEEVAGAVATREAAEAKTHRSESGMNSHREDAEVIIYADVDRNSLEQRIKNREILWARVNDMRTSLRVLADICGEISDLRGWRTLSARTQSLPGHELTDPVHRKQKFIWINEQVALLKDEKRKGEAATPEEWDKLFLELHDLLVASQAVLFELRAQTRDKDAVDQVRVPAETSAGSHEKTKDPVETSPRSETDQPERKRLTVEEKIARAQALLGRWAELTNEVGEHRLFSGIRARHPENFVLPHVKGIGEWIEKHVDPTTWGRWEKENRTKLNLCLRNLEGMVGDAEAVVSELRSAALPAEPKRVETEQSFDLREGDVWVREKDGKTERLAVVTLDAEKVNFSVTKQSGNEPAVAVGRGGKADIEKFRDALRTGGYKREGMARQPAATALSEPDSAARRNDGEGRVKFSEHVRRMQDLVDRLKKLEAEFGDAELRKAIREFRGVERLPSTRKIMMWFAGKESPGSWTGKSAAADRELLIDDALPTMVNMVHDAESVAKTLREGVPIVEPSVAAPSNGEAERRTKFEKGESQSEQAAIAFLERRQQGRIEVLRAIESKDDFDAYVKKVTSPTYSLDGDISVENVRKYLKKHEIDDDQAIGRVHTRAQALQDEVKKLYASKRAEFYPDATSTSVTVPVADRAAGEDKEGSPETLEDALGRAGKLLRDYLAREAEFATRDVFLEKIRELRAQEGRERRVPNVAKIQRWLGGNSVPGLWPPERAEEMEKDLRDYLLPDIEGLVRDAKQVYEIAKKEREAHGKGVGEKKEVAHTPDATEKWLNQLKTRIEAGPSGDVKDKLVKKLVAAGKDHVKLLDSTARYFEVSDKALPDEIAAIVGGEKVTHLKLYLRKLRKEFRAAVEELGLDDKNELSEEKQERLLGLIQDYAKSCRDLGRPLLPEIHAAELRALIQQFDIAYNDFFELSDRVHDIYAESFTRFEEFKEKKLMDVATTLSKGGEKTFEDLRSDILSMIDEINENLEKLKKPAVARPSQPIADSGEPAPSPARAATIEPGPSQEKEKGEFELLLKQKAEEYIEMFDARLKLEGYDADERLGHIAAYMPTLVKKCIEHYGQGIVWSPKERTRMITERIVAINLKD